MPTEVTDPALLEQLNGAPAAPAGKPVTDPKVLAQLEGKPAAPTRGPIDKLFGLKGERYQTWPERMIRETAEIPKHAIDAATAAPGTRAGTEAMIAPAAEAAMAATPMARGRLALPKKTKGVGTPTMEEHFTASNAGYKQVREDTLKLRKDVLEGLEDHIKDGLIEAGFRDYGHGNIFKAVEEISKPVGKGSPGDIYAVRDVLTNLAQNKDNAKAASLAIEKIDEYLSHIPDVAETANAARGNWKAGKQSQEIRREELRGEDNAMTSGLGGNLPNTLRQRLKTLIHNTSTSKYLNDAEKADIRDVLKRNSFDGLLETMARFGPKHPITGWGSAILADLSHGMGAASGLMATGHLSQKLAEWRMGRKIDKLDEGVRSKSPLAQSRQASGAMSKQGWKTPPEAVTYPAAGLMIADPQGKNAEEYMRQFPQLGR
jgi:hypothetical protein